MQKAIRSTDILTVLLILVAAPSVLHAEEAVTESDLFGEAASCAATQSVETAVEPAGENMFSTVYSCSNPYFCGGSCPGSQVCATPVNTQENCCEFSVFVCVDECTGSCSGGFCF